MVVLVLTVYIINIIYIITILYVSSYTYRAMYKADMHDCTATYNCMQYLAEDWSQSSAPAQDNLTSTLEEPTPRLWHTLPRVLNKIIGIIRHAKVSRANKYNDFLLIARHTKSRSKAFIKERCMYRAFGIQPPNAYNRHGWSEELSVYDLPTIDNPVHVWQAVNGKQGWSPLMVYTVRAAKLYCM